MTNEIEKQFFKHFGIEPRLVISLKDWESCKDLPRAEELFKHYPQITDSILLELICLLNNYGKNDTWAISVENLKDCILINCIKVIKEKDLKEMSLNNFKHKVRTLFEEG